MDGMGVVDAMEDEEQEEEEEDMVETEETEENDMCLSGVLENEFEREGVEREILVQLVQGSKGIGERGLLVLKLVSKEMEMNEDEKNGEGTDEKDVEETDEEDVEETDELRDG